MVRVKEKGPFERLRNVTRRGSCESLVHIGVEGPGERVFRIANRGQQLVGIGTIELGVDGEARRRLAKVSGNAAVNLSAKNSRRSAGFNVMTPWLRLTPECTFVSVVRS